MTSTVAGSLRPGTSMPNEARNVATLARSSGVATLHVKEAGDAGSRGYSDYDTFNHIIFFKVAKKIYTFSLLSHLVNT